MARERDDLRASGCAVFISSPEAAEAANDKWLTVQALARAGVGAPRSLSGRARDEIVDAVGFPMLSKPRHGRGGRGVEIHESPADLPSTSSDRIYQEFLPGEEYDVNLFAEPGGEPAALVVLRKTALRDGRVGNAAGVERVEAPDVADLAAATSRALRLEGALDIDVRRDKNAPNIYSIDTLVLPRMCVLLHRTTCRLRHAYTHDANFVSSNSLFRITPTPVTLRREWKKDISNEIKR